MAERESAFDWHSDRIAESTPVTSTYRNTQNVRRFLQEYGGPDFRFDREFMAWIKNGEPKTMGEVAIQWQQRSKRKG